MKTKGSDARKPVRENRLPCQSLFPAEWLDDGGLHGRDSDRKME